MPQSFACKFTGARISSFPAESEGTYYTSGSEHWPSSKYRVNEGAFLHGGERAGLGGVIRYWDAVFSWGSPCPQKPRKGLPAACPLNAVLPPLPRKNGVDVFLATVQVMGAETRC